MSGDSATAAGLCENCEHQPHYLKCVECSDWLCKGCCELHKKVRVTRQHHLVTQDDIKSGRARRFKLRDKALYRSCDKHDKDMRYFCETCKMPICIDCYATAQHTDHGRANIETRTGEIVAYLVKEAKGCKKYIEHTHVLLETWEFTEQKADSNRRKIRQELVERKRAIIEAAERQFAESMKRLDEEEAEIKKSSCDARKVLVEKWGNLKMAQKKTETFLKGAMPYEVLEDHKSHMEALHDYPDEKELAFPQWVKRTLVDVSHGDIRQGMAALFKMKSLKESVFPSPSLLFSFEAKGPDDGKAADLADAAVTANGQVAVADSGNKKIKLFKKDGRFVKSMPTELIGNLCSRVSNIPGDEEHLLVLDHEKSKETMMKWHMASNQVSKFCTESIGKSVIDSLGLGVSQHEDKSVVVIADYKESVLRLYNQAGKEVAQYDIDYGDCRFIAGHPRNDIVVINHSFKHLTAYRGGKKLWTKEKDKDGMPGAVGIAMDEFGNTLVCHTQDKSIKAYSANGDLLRTLLTAEDGLKGPRGVAYDSTHHLLVVVDAQGLVYVYLF